MDDECVEELGRPISSLKVIELRDELTKRALIKTGNKKELIDRLRAAILREQTKQDSETGNQTEQEQEIEEELSSEQEQKTEEEPKLQQEQKLEEESKPEQESQVEKQSEPEQQPDPQPTNTSETLNLIKPASPAATNDSLCKDEVEAQTRSDTDSINTCETLNLVESSTTIHPNDVQSKDEKEPGAPEPDVELTNSSETLNLVKPSTPSASNNVQSKDQEEFNELEPDLNPNKVSKTLNLTKPSTPIADGVLSQDKRESTQIEQDSELNNTSKTLNLVKPSSPVASNDVDKSHQPTTPAASNDLSREEKEPTQPEPDLEPTNTLMILNLVRPFTAAALKGVLSKHGPIKENKFWTDKVKSKCCVVFENADVAQQVRASLHGQQWPSLNPKTLSISYVSEEIFLQCQESELVKEVQPPKKAENGNDLKKEQVSKSITSRLGGRQDEVNDGTSTETVKKRLGEKATYDSNISREVDSGTSKKLDDLFRKTTTVPHLFWKPCPGSEKSQASDNSLNQRLGERLNNDAAVEEADTIEPPVKKRLVDRTSGDLSSTQVLSDKESETIKSRNLDDLFKKTDSIPHIFWLPLTDSEADLRRKVGQERSERVYREERT